jgi:hypothetical protein
MHAGGAMTTRVLLTLFVLLVLAWVLHDLHQWRRDRERDDEGDVLWQMSERVRRIRQRRRDGGG